MFKIHAYIVAFVCVSHAGAADWPNWRGPAHTGVSTETEWRASWRSSARPRALWKAAVGVGFSSMAVSDGKVVTLGFEGNRQRGKDTVWSFAAADGGLLWKHTYECPRWADEHEGGPAATPAIAGAHVYTLSKEGHLFCLSLARGKVVWSHNIRAKFKVPHRPSRPRKDYGYTGSPLVLGNRLIVPVGGKSANTVAFDRQTGKVVWRSGNQSGDTGAGYASPFPFDWQGKKYLAVFSLKALDVLDAADGDVVASHKWETSFGLNIAAPCVEDNLIFITSAYGKGSALLEFTGSDLKLRYRNNRLACKFSSPVLKDGFVYCATDPGVFKCLELKTGRLRWQKRGLAGASLIAAGDRLIFLGGKGQLLITEASPTRYRPLASAKVLSGKCWTAPVLARGLLYVRNTAGELVCFDLRERQKKPTSEAGR